MEIYVNVKEVRNANYNVLSIASKVGSAEKSLGSLRIRVAEEIASGQCIRQRLTDAYNEMNSLKYQINELYKITASCAAQYEAAEHANLHNAELFS